MVEVKTDKRTLRGPFGVRMPTDEPMLTAAVIRPVSVVLM